jgi:hypothetical protein
MRRGLNFELTTTKNAIMRLKMHTDKMLLCNRGDKKRERERERADREVFII